MNNNCDSDKRSIDERDFVSLISTNQRRILAYIITLVPNRSDAEEIMQETSVLMWEKRSDFIPGSDFVAWAARIAYYKILNYRKKAQQHQRMIIGDKQFLEIEKQAVSKSRHMEDVLTKLDECVKKISKLDRQLVYMRYFQNISVKEIATRINKSVRAVYLSISRIHDQLLMCLERAQP